MQSGTFPQAFPNQAAATPQPTFFQHPSPNMHQMSPSSFVQVLPSLPTPPPGLILVSMPQPPAGLVLQPIPQPVLVEKVREMELQLQAAGIAINMHKRRAEDAEAAESVIERQEGQLRTMERALDTERNVRMRLEEATGAGAKAKEAEIQELEDRAKTLEASARHDVQKVREESEAEIQKIKDSLIAAEERAMQAETRAKKAEDINGEAKTLIPQQRDYIKQLEKYGAELKGVLAHRTEKADRLFRELEENKKELEEYEKMFKIQDRELKHLRDNQSAAAAFAASPSDDELTLFGFAHQKTIKAACDGAQVMHRVRGFSRRS